LIEFNAGTPLQIGLQNTIGWFRENWERIDGSTIGAALSSENGQFTKNDVVSELNSIHVQ